MSGRLRQICGRALWLGVMLVTGVITGCALGDRPVESPSPVLSSQFRLTSPVFADESLIPAKFTCDGENISPMLQWDQPPTQTKSLALIVEDPDAPGQTFTHWVLYDLPPDTRQLPEKVSPQPFLQAGGLQGKSSFGKYGYGGPCPPSGTHRYLFKLYALDQILDLPPGTTQTDLVEAMQGHVLAEAKLTGKYARP